MATFKKQSFNNPYYFYAEKYGQNNPTQVKLKVDVTSDTLEVKVTKVFDDDTTEIAMWHRLTMQTLKDYGNGFVDVTMWGVRQNLPMVTDEDGNVTGPTIVKPKDLIDFFGITLASKTSAPVGFSSIENTWKTPYQIFIKDSSGNFDDATIVIKTPAEDGFDYTIEGNSTAAINAAEFYVRPAEIVPSISLTSTSTSVAPNGSVTVDVTCSDTSIKEVFLDQVYGMTNKARVPLTNGSGSFTLYATDLVAGDTVRVKAGYRKFTGISDIVIPVV
jgi:hypothetical protein